VSGAVSKNAYPHVMTAADDESAPVSVLRCLIVANRSTRNGLASTGGTTAARLSPCRSRGASDPSPYAARARYRSEADVIDDIDRTGSNSYYVSVNGRQVNVVTAVHNGRKYIKTQADGYAPNNLLSLPEPPDRLLP